MTKKKWTVEWCRKYLGAQAEGMTDAQIEQYRDYLVQVINGIYNRVLYNEKRTFERDK